MTEGYGALARYITGKGLAQGTFSAKGYREDYGMVKLGMGCAEIAWGEGEGCGEEGMVGMAVRLVVVPWGFECRDEQTEFIADKVGTLKGFLPRCSTEEALIQWNPFLGAASNMCSIASIDYRQCSRIRMSQLNQN